MPADSRFGRPAYGVGYHDSKGHMALPHCSAGTRASQGPLAPDGLFGPRFSEVLAHQQSVRGNRSRFGAILTGSSRQQAGRKRGPGRSQCSRGPPPTPAPVQQQQQPQQQPPQTGRAAPRTGKFRKLAPTFSFPIKEKSKDRSAERQYMPGGCRMAVGRPVHMASGSPASKKRRPLEPRGRIRDSLHEPVDTAACIGLLVPHIIPSTSLQQFVGGEETGPRAVATACAQRMRTAVGSPSLRPLCVLARAVRSAIVVGHHVEMGPSHTVQASSPTLYGVGGDHATGPGCEHGSGSRGGTSLGLMAAAHHVVPLGQLFMRRLQLWFARQRLDPRRHKLRVLLVPRSVSPDLEYWKRPSALLRGVRPLQHT
ncbi:unnamed protein product [Boreogadus saida]